MRLKAEKEKALKELNSFDWDHDDDKELEA